VIDLCHFLVNEVKLLLLWGTKVNFILRAIHIMQAQRKAGRILKSRVMALELIGIKLLIISLCYLRIWSLKFGSTACWTLVCIFVLIGAIHVILILRDWPLHFDARQKLWGRNCALHIRVAAKVVLWGLVILIKPAAIVFILATRICAIFVVKFFNAVQILIWSQVYSHIIYLLTLSTWWSWILVESIRCISL